LAARTGHPYPHQQLEQLWRRTLLLQFHDILPGSSIAWVNQEAITEFIAIRAELDQLMDDAWQALLQASGGETAGVSVVNPSQADRREVLT
ncbi:hypothetical protein ACQUZI_10040, partial [Streptococcus pyogenes]